MWFGLPLTPPRPSATVQPGQALMPSLITTYSTNILTTFSLAKAFTWLISLFYIQPGNKETKRKFSKNIANLLPILFVEIMLLISTLLMKFQMYSWHFQHSLPKSALKKLKRWERAQEGGHSKYFDRGLLLGKKWCSRSQDRCYIQSTQVKSGATPTTHHPPPILYFLPTMGPIVGKKFNFLPSLLKLSQSGPCLPRVCGSMCLYSIVSILWQISRY